MKAVELGRSRQREPGREARITVAAIQTHAPAGDKRGNNERALEALHRACDKGARVIVLPELGNSGYLFNSHEEVAEAAEPASGGETTMMWARVARERDVYICGGLAEVDNGRFFNSAVIIGPKGFVGRYRKLHLWDEEKLFFEPGDLGLNVFHLPFGRVAIMLCYDGWHPEVARILKLKGADLILDPTCWVRSSVDTPENRVSAYVHMALAHVNSLFIVCANQCGSDRGCTFLGSSCIVGPAGFVAGPAGYESPELLIADLNLARARYHNWTSLANLFADRRTDLFDEMLGYRAPTNWTAAFRASEEPLAAKSPDVFAQTHDRRGRGCCNSV
jgi:N-carbamoylputrescine amidase